MYLWVSCSVRQAEACSSHVLCSMVKAMCHLNLIDVRRLHDSTCVVCTPRPAVFRYSCIPVWVLVRCCGNSSCVSSGRTIVLGGLVREELNSSFSSCNYYKKLMGMIHSFNVTECLSISRECLFIKLQKMKHLTNSETVILMT